VVGQSTPSIALGERAFGWRRAAGAATGLAALMGARAVIPPGATGRRGSDLVGKRRAAVAAIEVCPNHGCDPATGAHVGGQVPRVWWSGA